MINTEILLLGALCGMTILAYMIAINAHGAVRLSISFFLATILLAGSVYCIVQYVNVGEEQQKKQAIQTVQQLSAEKQQAEEQRLRAELQLKSNEQLLEENKEKMVLAGKLNALVAAGSALANRVNSIDLHDMALELDGLMARATEAKAKADGLSAEFGQIDVSKGYYADAIPLMKNGIAQLVEACRYYTMYYRSEDAAQEGLRENLLRQKSKAAAGDFGKAAGILSGAGN